LNFLIIIGILVLLVCVALWLSRVFMAKAIRSLIVALREAGATSSASARTAEELNLRPKSTIRDFRVVRDYGPYAFQILVRAGVVEVTEDGRLFLLEERLAMSRWSGQ
jgi:hypothetical protein